MEDKVLVPNWKGEELIKQEEGSEKRDIGLEWLREAGRSRTCSRADLKQNYKTRVRFLQAEGRGGDDRKVFKGAYPLCRHRLGPGATVKQVAGTAVRLASGLGSRPQSSQAGGHKL